MSNQNIHIGIDMAQPGSDLTVIAIGTVLTDKEVRLIEFQEFLIKTACAIYGVPASEISPAVFKGN